MHEVFPGWNEVDLILAAEFSIDVVVFGVTWEGCL